MLTADKITKVAKTNEPRPLRAPRARANLGLGGKPRLLLWGVSGPFHRRSAIRQGWRCDTSNVVRKPSMAKDDHSTLPDEMQELQQEAAALTERAKKTALQAEVLSEPIKQLQTQIAKQSWGRSPAGGQFQPVFAHELCWRILCGTLVSSGGSRSRVSCLSAG